MSKELAAAIARARYLWALRYPELAGEQLTIPGLEA